MKLRFVKTCDMCPEQYDVYNNGKIIAYVRIRHGFCRCDCPYCGGDTVYVSTISGDGEFNSNKERKHHLSNVTNAIKNYYKQEQNKYV